MYSRAVTHSWAFWDDQPVEGERDKDQDDGHGEQEREDESGKLFFWGVHIFIRCRFQANPLTVYLRMEVGAIRHEVANEVKKPRRLNMAAWAAARDNLLTLITTRNI